MAFDRTGRIAFAAVAALLLAGCDSMDMFTSKPQVPLPGERLSILALDSQLEPDPRIADLQVRLPRPWVNNEWPQPGGYSSHVMHHLALGGSLRQVWRTSIGSSASSDERILAQPLVVDGRLFAMDAESNVAAFDAETGNRLWRADLTPRSEDRGAIGGGIAYDGGKLFATTAYGDVYALDPATGQFFWRQRIGVPLRSPPAADGGRVFIVTQDNQIKALSAATGSEEWSFAGIVEVAGLLGSATPAVDSGVVIAPFSSGELFALSTANGAVAWSDALQRTGRVSSVGTINDIAGNPVIDRGRVYAIGHGGRMVAIDVRTGERVWERELSGLQSPWLAGDFVFLVTLDGEVVCLSRRDGRIRWVTQLERFKDPTAKAKKGAIIWYGPVLAGDRLVLTSSHGQAVSLSPYTGEMLGKIKLSGNAALPPVVANETLYILTDDANLVALR